MNLGFGSSVCLLFVALYLPTRSQDLGVFKDVGGQGWRVRGGSVIWPRRDVVFHYAELTLIPTECHLLRLPVRNITFTILTKAAKTEARPNSNLQILD